MSKLQIKSRWNSEKILYQGEAESFKVLIEAAVKSGANLRGANLHGANLRGANLQSANLRGANLYGADLSGVNLSGANLYGANLYGANLQSADLQSADLYGANLRYANLRGADLQSADLRSAGMQSADLYGANLRYANLRGADLRGADLQSADLPAPTMVLLATWGELSPKLTTELMKYDAFFHPNPKAFAEWAKDGSCPYSNVKVQRAANFLENKKLWKKGTPKSGYALMVAVLREKTKTDL